jgi:hypothetical protein
MIGAATNSHWIELAAAIVKQAAQDKDYRYVAACQEAARNGAGCYAPLEAIKMLRDGWQPDEDFAYAGRQRKRASRNSKARRASNKETTL